MTAFGTAFVFVAALIVSAVRAETGTVDAGILSTKKVITTRNSATPTMASPIVRILSDRCGKK
jgi:archaellin